MSNNDIIREIDSKYDWSDGGNLHRCHECNVLFVCHKSTVDGNGDGGGWCIDYVEDVLELDGTHPVFFCSLACHNFFMDRP